MTRRELRKPDTKAPVTTITTGPADGSFTAGTSFTFNFTVDEPQATTECRLGNSRKTKKTIRLK